ncbi:MAG: hypothetical protein IT307_15105, partial [Chloroflexi bacterium]|nr:hypothetical protein [Chloroflexota bacterium]
PADRWSAWTLSQPWVSGQPIVLDGQALYVHDAAIDVFDSATGSWSQHALASPRRNAGVATVNHLVLLAGGESEAGPSDAVDLYDAEAHAWSTARLAAPRAAPAVAVVVGQAIFAGGNAAGTASAVTDVYDSVSGAWSQALLRDSRKVYTPWDRAFTAVTVRDRAYVVGGGTVNVYDGSTGTWSATERSETSPVVLRIVGTKLVFASDGGYYFANRPIDVLDTETGNWSTTLFTGPPGTTFERSVDTTLTVGSKVIFAGGTVPLRANRVSTGSVSVFNANTGQWSTAALTSGGTQGAFVYGTKAVFPGSRAIDVYDSALDQWNSYPLSQERHDFAVVNAGSLLLVGGGSVGYIQPYVGVSDTVDVLDLETGAQSVTSLSQARTRLAAAASGRLAIFVGGLDAGSDRPPSAVDVYDTTSGAWASAPLSEPSGGYRGVRAGDQLLLYSASFSPPATVDLYDSGSDTWTVLPLSVPRANAALAAIDSVAVVAGGHFSETPRDPSDVVDILDLRAHTMVSGRLSQARSRSSALAVGRKVLIAGGEAAGTGAGIDSTTQSNLVDIYDVDRHEWSVTTFSEQRRGAMASAAVGSKAILAGGVSLLQRNPSGGVIAVRTDTADVYDAVTETWSVARLSAPRSGMDVAVVGERAVFAGGVPGVENNRDVLSTAVDVYDAAADRWSSSTRPLARRASRVLVVGDIAIFAGDDDQVELYDAAADRWTLKRLPAGNKAPAMAAAGATAIFAGGAVPIGSGGDTKASDAVDLFDSRTGAWSHTTLSRPRRNLGAGGNSGTAIFAGGGADYYPSALVDVYRAPELSHAD